MENPIAVTLLNDFIFCPASIYYHMVDANPDKLTYGSHEQIEGAGMHSSIDQGTYSSNPNILQGIEVFSEEFGLIGKIDLFDIQTGILRERKRKVTHIYDGYIFQLYGYCFALREMGYTVTGLCIHSLMDNKNYPIALPENDEAMFDKFVRTLDAVRTFKMDSFSQTNPEKCAKCVYEPLCPYSCLPL